MTIPGSTDTFDGHSNTTYKNWLQVVQPRVTHVYSSFVEETVADQCDGVWTTGSVEYLHQGILSSMTHTLPTNRILSNKSHPFSIVSTDNNDSICDLPSLLTYLDNFERKNHTAATTRSPTTGGRTCRVSNGETVWRHMCNHCGPGNLFSSTSTHPSSGTIDPPTCPQLDAWRSLLARYRTGTGPLSTDTMTSLIPAVPQSWDPVQ